MSYFYSFRAHSGGSRIWGMKNILYTIILSFLFSSAASAEIYKWVDDEGKVHYGEKLPNNATGKAVETIKTKDSVSADFQAGIDAYKKGDYNNILYIIILSIILGVILVSYRHYHGPYTKAFGFDLSQLKRWHWNVIIIVVLLINLYAWLL